MEDGSRKKKFKDNFLRCIILHFNSRPLGRINSHSISPSTRIFVYAAPIPLSPFLSSSPSPSSSPFSPFCPTIKLTLFSYSFISTPNYQTQFPVHSLFTLPLFPVPHFLFFSLSLSLLLTFLFFVLLSNLTHFPTPSYLTPTPKPYFSFL